MADDAMIDLDESAEGTSPEDKIPFFIKKHACPVCTTSSPFPTFKVKIYAEKKPEIDKHFQEYTWQDPDFKSYHPPLYYFWHCPSCHFTDSSIDFPNPTKHSWSNFRTVKEELQFKVQDDKIVKKVVNWLGKGIDYDNISYAMAFKLHLLALYIQNMVEDDDKDTLKLGRYYLRTGWLLREMNEKNHGDLKTAMGIIKELKKVWKDLPEDEQGFLLKAVEYLNMAFRAHPAIKNVVSECDMLLWIGGIYLKVPDETKGLEAMNQVIQRGTKTKAKIEERNRKASEEEQKQNNIMLKKISAIVAKARDLLADIQAKKMKIARAKARKIVDKMTGQEREVIEAALIKKGFVARVYEPLLPPKKKKRFGIF